MRAGRQLLFSLLLMARSPNGVHFVPQAQRNPTVFFTAFFFFFSFSPSFLIWALVPVKGWGHVRTVQARTDVRR